MRTAPPSEKTIPFYKGSGFFPKLCKDLGVKCFILGNLWNYSLTKVYIWYILEPTWSCIPGPCMSLTPMVVCRQNVVIKVEEKYNKRALTSCPETGLIYSTWTKQKCNEKNKTKNKAVEQVLVIRRGSPVVYYSRKSMVE